jgi:hypothetical protein
MAHPSAIDEPRNVPPSNGSLKILRTRILGTVFKSFNTSQLSEVSEVYNAIDERGQPDDL